MSLNHDNYDINKNILNRITYLINKRLSNFNLNKIDNIYENTKTLINEFPARTPARKKPRHPDKMVYEEHP